MAKPTVFVLVPMDAPDPEGMVASLLRPFNVRFAPDNVLQWPYHDYWGFEDVVTGNYVGSAYQCRMSVWEITENMEAAAIITPDGELHDCCNPIVWRNLGGSFRVAEWNALCAQDLQEYRDCMVIPVWVHY